jgi:hypothetical protein
MPRDGSGIYSRPAGIDAVTDTTIESAKYNLNVQDVEADLNWPRPISSGGTGASNAADAMVALGGEIANQAVTNYDTFQFNSGSFWSGPGATSSPEGAAPATAYFEGICYSTAPGFVNFYIEARNLNTNVKYLRRKLSGVWQPWVRDDASDKVDRAGDIMTGALTIVDATPTINLNKNVSGSPGDIWFQTNSVNRWFLRGSSGDPESGGNAGSNFQVVRFNDAGGILDVPFNISRATGQITGNGVVPAAANDLVNKAYVDGTGSTGLAGKVSKAGDSMSGNLNVDAYILARNSTNNASISIHAGAGSYGTIQAFDYNVTVQKNIVMQESGGNVGIGTNAPGTFKLNVNGGIKADSIIANVDYSYIGANLQTRPTNAYAVGAIGWNYSTQEVGFWNTYTGGGTNSFVFRQLTSGGAAHTDLMTISQNGNLNVAGSITAAGVPVGGRVLLATLTASNSAFLADTSSLTATYPSYEIVFENLVPVTNAANLAMQVRSGGSFQGTAYAHGLNAIDASVPNNTPIGNVGTAVNIPLSFLNISNTAVAGGFNGHIRVNRPSGTTSYKAWYGSAIVLANNTNFNTLTIGGAWKGNTGAIDGVSFFMNSGNIASGVIRIYGLL